MELPNKLLVIFNYFSQEEILILKTRITQTQMAQIKPVQTWSSHWR